jgi:hypothetical protein
VRWQHLAQHGLFAFFGISRHGSLVFAPCCGYSPARWRRQLA